MCRPRLIIHLQILLGISPISEEWLRIWSKSMPYVAAERYRGTRRGRGADSQNQNA
jgi:hypothetical protein